MKVLEGFWYVILLLMLFNNNKSYMRVIPKRPSFRRKYTTIILELYILKIVKSFFCYVMILLLLLFNVKCFIFLSTLFTLFYMFCCCWILFGSKDRKVFASNQTKCKHFNANQVGPFHGCFKNILEHINFKVSV